MEDSKYGRFGNAVKKYRAMIKKTVYEVADFVGVSHTYISQIENGKKIPSEKVLFPLIYFLGIKSNHGHFEEGGLMETHELELLNIYAEYKNTSYNALFEEYGKYLDEQYAKVFDPTKRLSEAIKNNHIQIDKRSYEVTEIETPYFDLKWLLTQKQYEVLYGNEYNFLSLNNSEDVQKKKLAFNILNDEDVKTIHDLIEAYLSNKYSKFK